MRAAKLMCSGAILFWCCLALRPLPVLADLTREEIFDPRGIALARLSPDDKHIASIVYA